MPALLLLLASFFTLKVTPSVSFAPAKLAIVVRVSPNPDARALVVLMDGEDYARSSVIPMNGAEAPVTNRLEWRDVPAGHYEIIARLLGTTKVLASTTTQVTVEGRD